MTAQTTGDPDTATDLSTHQERVGRHIPYASWDGPRRGHAVRGPATVQWQRSGEDEIIDAIPETGQIHAETPVVQASVGVDAVTYLAGEGWRSNLHAGPTCVPAARVSLKNRRVPVGTRDLGPDFDTFLRSPVGTDGPCDIRCRLRIRFAELVVRHGREPLAFQPCSNLYIQSGGDRRLGTARHPRHGGRPGRLR